MQEIRQLQQKIAEAQHRAREAREFAQHSDGNTWTEITRGAYQSADAADAEVSRLKEELAQLRKRIQESAQVPETQVMSFFQKWNKGEFPQSWRMGQAFVNHFGLAHPQCDVPNGPCLFHIRDVGKATKAIWEHFTKVDS